MIALFLAPMYLFLNWYILHWHLKWMKNFSEFFGKKSVRAAFAAIYTLLAAALAIGFFAPDGSFLKRCANQVGYTWLGVMLYSLLVIAIGDLARVVLRKILRRNGKDDTVMSGKLFGVTGSLCAAIIIFMCVWGMVSARVIRTTNYDIDVAKSIGGDKDMRIVLVADMHLGYNIGCRQMKRMVSAINAADADIVVIAGDIFDNEYASVENPDEMAEILRGIKSRYGVYACYGNHDIEEKILAGFTFGGDNGKKESSLEMDAFLEKSGIELLRDEYRLIDNKFYVYGRPDYRRLGRGIEERKTPAQITEDMDASKPIIVIDHEPLELSELSEAGVDMDLCGHTHDGQTFPGNLTINLMWENACGYLEKGDMHNIVTSGVGVFGPFMRLGTKSEICVIDAHFE